MDSSQKRKLEYTRKWKSAKKSLRQLEGTHAEKDSSSSSENEQRESESVSLPLSQPGTSGQSEEQELGQPEDPHVETESSSEQEQRESEIIAQPVSQPGMCEQPEPQPSGSSGAGVEHPELQSGSQMATDAEIWQAIDSQLVVSSDTNDSDSSASNDFALGEDLSEWASTFMIKQNAVDALLKMLRKRGHPALPASARTLLKTTREVTTQVKSGMDYFNLGVKNQIIKYWKKYPGESRMHTETVSISLNIDGLPIFRSSRKALWPVLCAIDMEPLRVFPVALAYGDSKPKDCDFLQDTVLELKELLQTGIKFEENVIKLELKSIICDAPAKAMVKNMKLYSGYHGCDRCTQEGVWHGRMTYQDVKNIEPRTDDSFRSQADEEHHHGVSEFCKLPIDMIKAFPIDYMHQACLGVMRRLILLWLRGKKDVKISATQSQQISERLRLLKGSIPAIFARKPRPLSEVDHWKATEYRQFLLYTGKLVLKGILRPDLYKHFVILNVAMAILVSPKLVEEHSEYAQELLEYFVEQGRQLYGPEFLVYNVHSMVHIAASAKEHGSLDGCSAFPFENYLQHMKKMVRSGRNPLVQIVKRLGELESHDSIKRGDKCKISAKPPNNYFILDDKKCCEVVTLNEGKGKESKKLEHLCRVYEKAEPLFSAPCDSRIIGGYVVHKKHACMRWIAQEYLSKRAIMVEEDGGTKNVFLAVLHEF